MSNNLSLSRSLPPFSPMCVCVSQRERERERERERARRGCVDALACVLAYVAYVFILTYIEIIFLVRREIIIKGNKRPQNSRPNI